MCLGSSRDEGVFCGVGDAGRTKDDALGCMFILAVKSEPSADSSSEHSPFTGADNTDSFSPGEWSNLLLCATPHQPLHVGYYLYH